MQPLRFDLSLGVIHDYVNKVIPLNLSGVLYGEHNRIELTGACRAQVDLACPWRGGLVGTDKGRYVDCRADHQYSNEKRDNRVTSNSAGTRCQPHVQPRNGISSVGSNIKPFAVDVNTPA